MKSFKASTMGLRRTCAGPFAIAVLIATLAVNAQTSTAAEALTKWTSTSGDWTDSTHWSNGLPDPYKHVEIHGTATVHVPPGAYPIANLQIGKNSGDHTRVEIDGGKVLLLQDPLDLGDVTGSRRASN